MKLESIRLKLAKTIKYMSIKTKISITILFFTIAFLLVTNLLTYSIVSDIVKEKVFTNLDTLNHQYAVNIDNKAKELKSTSYSLLANEEITSLLVNGEGGKINGNDMLESVCSRYLLANKYIRYISVMDLKGEVYLWNNSGTGMQMIDVKQVMEVAKKDLFLYDTDHMWIDEIWGQEDMTTYIKTVVDAGSLKTIGYAVITVDDEYFKEGLGAFEEGHHMNVFNRFDEMLLADGDYKEAELSFSYLKEQSIYYSEEVYMNRGHVKGADWTTNLMVEQEYIYNDLDSLKFIFVIIFLAISVIISILVSLIISRTTRDLRVLEKSMRKIEEGDYSTRIKPRTYDEVGLLSLRFNYMSHKIDNLINEVYVEQLERQKKEFQVLQAQINPHFLYNTLGTIKWNAHINDNEEMETYADAFIELLKLTAKSDNEYITVEQEISYVKNYVTLQKYRYESALEVVFDVDEVLLEEKVLKFMLQPLVENCIFHAFSYKDKNGIIKISVLDKSEKILLTVEDNGKGMSEEQIEQVISKESANAGKGLNSIGVKNVNERLQLYYGKEFGLHVVSELGRFTRIEILVPKLKEENIEEVHTCD